MHVHALHSDFADRTDIFDGPSSTPGRAVVARLFFYWEELRLVGSSFNARRLQGLSLVGTLCLLVSCHSLPPDATDGGVADPFAFDLLAYELASLSTSLPHCTLDCYLPFNHSAAMPTDLEMASYADSKGATFSQNQADSPTNAKESASMSRDDYDMRRMGKTAEFKVGMNGPTPTIVEGTHCSLTAWPSATA